MSTHVVGFIPPDDEWFRMKAVWDACKEADVNPPELVQRFFDHVDFEPGDHGQEIEIPHREWTDDDHRDGMEIVLEELPENVKIIRFYNSW